MLDGQSSSKEVYVKRLHHLMRSLVVVVALFVTVSSAVQAADLSRPVLLVARDRWAGSPFERAVILATPLPNGAHVGFVVNHPTDVTLGTLFPEQAAARNVVGPVYAGGPMLSSVVFAVMRDAAPASDGKVVPLMPGLVAAMDGPTVDHIIETRPNDARYFVGLMLWTRGELDRDVEDGAWEVRPASVDAVLPDHATDLWESFAGTAL